MVYLVKLRKRIVHIIVYIEFKEAKKNADDTKLYNLKRVSLMTKRLVFVDCVTSIDQNLTIISTAK